MSTNAHILTTSGLTIFVDGQMHTVSKDHVNFEAVKKAVIRKDWAEALRLADIGTTSARWAEDVGDVDFRIADGIVYYKGTAYSPAVSEKVVRMIREGFDPAPLYAFLRKVEENPARSAREELLLFCEANDFAITEDGDILGFKGVRPDHTDWYTGTIDNSVGQVHEMPRNQVDDDRSKQCSVGYHVAALSYAQTLLGWSRSGYVPGTGAVMVTKTHPRDVVSVPNDYENRKMRVSRYEVIAELPSKEALPPQREVYKTSDFTTGAEVETALRAYLRETHGVEVNYLGQDFDDLGLGSNDARAAVRFLAERAGVSDRINEWDFDVYTSFGRLLGAVQNEVEVKQQEEDEEDGSFEPDDDQDDDYHGGCGGY